MIIELEVISQLPVKVKGKSIARYIPERIFQKKLFITEGMQIEEHMNPNGKVISRFTTCKYDTEYYKINTPYIKLRDAYFTPIVIRGLGK